MGANKNKVSISLLLIRIMLGITMALHGIQKFMNLSDTTDFFVSLGLPSFMPIIIALIEVVGGSFMIIGLLVPLVSLGFIAILGTAIFMLKSTSGFVNGYELELLLIVMSIASGYAHLNKKIIQFMPPSA
ncbi:doxX family protein [Carnobacterium maltaromaticum]|uniref:DoxX family protein n=1 Tax=Carnobacterium maltaromaticum TaxID=2751 RepID=UPI001072E99F|nr:DoxX family protein [Carnobacterium maltaromaticum]MDT1943405.1 DoxX family protein [Carnobacterium maltaromaticum]MDT1998785.1 DoxX family protein [Carnobacterium maltaromaticum]TFJ24769.1 doxX family protein [Carnobacterium maltaromaticum]TFJ30174.1 doxX family protein [Carnobacterium maltaromaticum]TFJ33313.1 doxX family protein [Carnobacterium maltaromaticum]